MAAVLYTGAQLFKTQSGVIGIACIRANNYSDANLPKAYKLSQLKRGTGGRSSFNGVVATVFGATGFVGRYVVNKLGKTGSQVIIPYRGDFIDVARLKVAGDLGQILFMPYHLRDQTSLEKAVKYSNVVINLVGREWETKNFKLDDVNVIGARDIALAAKNAGVQKFIHLSALNCSPEPDAYFIKGGSKFYISKYRGEEAVRDVFPEAVIIRPSDIYGQEDRFLKYYAHGWRRDGNAIGLYKAGESTVKQPVFVSDVAQGIMNAIRDPDADGKVFQAVGPKRYRLCDLVDYIFKLMEGEDWDISNRYDLSKNFIFKWRVNMTEYLPGAPPGFMIWERIERECHNDKFDKKIPTLEDLQVCLTSVEQQFPWELRSIVAHQGPKRYKLGDLVDWIFKCTGEYKEGWGYWRYDMKYNPFLWLRAQITDQYLPGTPPGKLCMERFERECHTDVVDRNLPTLEDLGVTLTHMEDQVPWELRPFLIDLYQRRADNINLPNPAPPKAVAM